MLTREALQESLEQAMQDYARAPVDGMLAYLLTVVELKSEKWTQDNAAVVALAYANAVQKNGGSG